MFIFERSLLSVVAGLLTAIAIVAIIWLTDY
jgi:hypothetical protein